jgi:hypothetical protein
MSKRFKQVNVQHFATLLKELDVDLMTQPQFVREIEELYMSIFRHNTSGDFVVETLPNEKGNWKVHKPSATKEEVMELIKKGQVIWNKDVI